MKPNYAKKGDAGFESAAGIVSIEVDENTWVETKSDYIKQN